MLVSFTTIELVLIYCFCIHSQKCHLKLGSSCYLCCINRKMLLSKLQHFVSYFSNCFHFNIFLIFFNSDDLLIDNPIEDMSILIHFLNTWKCPLGTAVQCFEDLGRALAGRGSLSKQNFEVIGKT
jgi:hypothetical protein